VESPRKHGMLIYEYNFRACK